MGWGNLGHGGSKNLSKRVNNHRSWPIYLSISSKGEIKHQSSFCIKSICFVLNFGIGKGVKQYPIVGIHHQVRIKCLNGKEGVVVSIDELEVSSHKVKVIDASEIVKPWEYLMKEWD